MKKQFTHILFVCSAFLLLPVSLHAQQFQWVRGGGTNQSSADLDDNPEGTYFMCTDPNGNVYALSNVGDDAIYADSFYRSSAYGPDRNILLTSYNCQGQMRWAKLIASSADQCFPFGIISDSLGHVYVAGYLTNGNLHIGYDTTISGSVYDLLGLIQFDTSGHFNWIRYVGNNTVASYDATTIFASLSIDNASNVHFIPYLKSGAVLMPGVTSHYGNYDLKYNASGTLLSARRLQIDSTILVAGISIDKQSNTLYAYGYRNLLFADSSDYNFIGAFDTSGNRKWLDTLGLDPAYLSTQNFSGIAPDNAGHLYISGVGFGYLIYQGDTIYPTTGAYISFIMKTDTSGNKKWFSQCNGNSGLGGITLMPNNKVGAVGSYYETVTCGTHSISNTTSGSDPFIYIVDTSGSLVALQGIHGDGYEDGGITMACDKIGNLYIGGEVADSIPDTLVPAYHSIGGNTDFFILKYGVDCSCTSMPVAAYTAIGTSTVSVTYTGTSASGIDSVVWNFGDGHTATGLTTSHIYTVVGTVDLCVTVYTGCGYDIYCSNITVNCTGAIISAFTDTGSTIRGFTYTGTTAGLDSVKWNFGDGHTAIGATALHTYSTSGTYTVCATVYTGCGSNTGCNDVVINCTPVSSFTSTGATTRNFTYTGTSISLDSVVWNFGDGYTASGITPSHTYSLSGTYTVCATVFTSCGNNTSCNSIVINCTPVSSFTHSGTSPVGFTYTGTTVGLDSVVWNYGDGSTGLGSITTHTYSLSGTYSVCATVYATCGSNTYCNDIVVNCAPTASFTDTGTVTRGFTYTGTTSGLDSVVWNFGDGHTSTGTIVLHTYTLSGTYTVCATVYTNCGNDSACRTVIITTTGIQGITVSAIKVFPNPAGDELTVTGVPENMEYRLLTVTGISALNGVFHTGENVLRMQNVVPGVYILEITALNGERSMIRVVKE